MRAIISMAKALNLTVTAEGIEKVEQSDLLRGSELRQPLGYAIVGGLIVS